MLNKRGEIINIKIFVSFYDFTQLDFLVSHLE